MTETPTTNKDRELWREVEGDACAASIHVTSSGGIGIDVGGTVYVLPVRKWHKLARDFADQVSLHPSVRKANHLD